MQQNKLHDNQNLHEYLYFSNILLVGPFLQKGLNLLYIGQRIFYEI